MRLLIIHGVQKYNLDVPDSAIGQSEQTKNGDTTGQVGNMNGQHQPEVDSQDQTQGIETWPLQKLKEEIEKLTGVPVDGQRLIKKGSAIFGDHMPLSTFNFNDGDKIMVLGQKPQMQENPALKSLATIEKTVLGGIEENIKDVEERLRGIQQGFLSKDLVNSALNELGKRLKILGEDCMKTLELMDAMRLSEDVNDRARTKRKTLVVRVQSLLRWHDELIELLGEVVSDSNEKGKLSV